MPEVTRKEHDDEVMEIEPKGHAQYRVTCKKCGLWLIIPAHQE